MDHAINVPAKHLGLLVFRVAKRIHAEFAQNEWSIFGQILQPQEIAFEITLIVEVNVETEEIHILRKEIFGWRIGGIGKQDVRIK